MALSQDQIAAIIRAQHDQDLMAGRQWWREQDEAVKTRLWVSLNKPHYSAITEVVARLAILGFEQLALDSMDHVEGDQ